MNNIEKLNAAFIELRKQGFIARQYFKCCGSCAGYDLANKVSQMPDKRRAKVKGAVFTTRQDRGSNTLFIKYGPLETTKWGKIGLDEVNIGEAIVAAFKSQKLNVEWSGSANECVQVNL